MPTSSIPNRAPTARKRPNEYVAASPNMVTPRSNVSSNGISNSLLKIIKTSARQFYVGQIVYLCEFEAVFKFFSKRLIGYYGSLDFS